MLETLAKGSRCVPYPAVAQQQPDITQHKEIWNPPFLVINKPSQTGILSSGGVQSTVQSIRGKVTLCFNINSDGCKRISMRDDTLQEFSNTLTRAL
jgi:hypothetical protein